MEKKELNTKLVSKYWKEVFTRAFKSLWDEMTMRVVIITFILSLLIMCISSVLLMLGWVQASFLVNRITDFQAVLYTFLSIIVVFIALLLRSIYSIPAQMYDELGGFNEDPFLLSARKPLPKHQSEPRWASIDVINTSHTTIEKCFLTLDDIFDSEGNSIIYSRQRRLLWSWGEGAENREKELDIFPNVPRIADVAVTDQAGRISLTVLAGEQLLKKGIYEIVVSAHGQWKSIPKEKTSNFIVEYEGQNILTIVEKGNKKWEDSNPKKIKRTKDEINVSKASPSS